jgi:hypothetical protein
VLPRTENGIEGPDFFSLNNDCCQLWSKEIVAEEPNVFSLIDDHGQSIFVLCSQ